MKELNSIEAEVKSVAKRGIAEEIQKLISFLRQLLSTLGGKEELAPAPQPEPKPAPQRDIVYEGILRDRRSANREFAWKKDGALKDSY